MASYWGMAIDSSRNRTEERRSAAALALRTRGRRGPARPRGDVVRLISRGWLAVLALAGACSGPAHRDASERVAGGLRQLKAGDSAAALAVFDSILTEDTTNAAAYRARGFLHQTAGRYDRAIQDYDHAIANNRRYAIAYNNRGFTYQLEGKYTRAVADYDSALALNPALPVAIANRGRAQFYLGQFDRAAADLGKALQRDSTNAFLAVWLHIVRMRMGAGDSSELARAVARTDSARWPAPVAQFYLGKLTEPALDAAASKGDARAQQLQRCGAAFYAGELLLWTKKLEAATEHLERAKSICPADASEAHGAAAELGRMASTARVTPARE